jgi:glycosyltransferase involved in cell wall biosynthesis
VDVGLNLIFLVPGETGGRETYVRELIPRLRAAEPDLRLTLFVNREAAAGRGEPWHEAGRVVRLPVSGRSRAQWALGEQVLLPRYAARAGVDLVHSPGNFAPAWGRFARVTTVHDLLYLRYPEFHSPLMRWGTGALLPLGARRANRVITVSRASRDELVALLGLPPERIDVVPNGTTRGAAAARPWRPEGVGERPIVLSVATRLRHKNMDALVEAAGLIPAPQRPAFVLAGGATELDAELRAHAAEVGVERDVILLPRLPPHQLDGLYAAATCYAMPTLYEGFGLPVLEAMARGVPVACSDIPVLREVAGDAAHWFDPRDPVTIAAAVRELIGDEALRERLRAAGTERASSFTWEAAAGATIESYQRAVDSAGRSPKRPRLRSP